MLLQEKAIKTLNELMPFIDNLEKAGLKNIYHCHYCGNDIVTINKDNGTTPLKTECICGDGYLQSKCYEVSQDIIPEWEWYRPSEAEILLIKSENTLNHIAKGGLILRKVQ